MAPKCKSNIGDQERSETRMGRGKPINNLQHLRLSFYELESRHCGTARRAGAHAEGALGASVVRKECPPEKAALHFSACTIAISPSVVQPSHKTGKQASGHWLATAALQHSLFAASGDSQERSVRK